VKAISLVSLTLVPFVVAQDASDNIAIGRTIQALNESPIRLSLFASDTNAAAELARLPKGVVKFRIPDAIGSSQPTLTISKEPWGEATINFPGFPAVFELPTIEINSRILSGAIRFITPDVALAEGTLTIKGDGDETRTTPLLFVMKKEHDQWKIASIRVVTAR
jgi:hypothetical protein